MITEIILLIVGAFAVFLVDIGWWSINFKKVEKGMEAHEHYHVGIELLIAGIVVSYFVDWPVYLMLGAGFAFIMAEWRQVVEIKKTENNKVTKKDVTPGHPFAIGSGHDAQSHTIGIGLSAVLGVLLFLKLGNFLL